MMSGYPAPRHNLNYVFGESISTTHRDITDERYRDLRRPRKVTFLCNGDKYFKGKRIPITPHRYLNFNDLMNDLTGKLPPSANLPYGVRQIYASVDGKPIKEIDELQDGESYVCAGFEPFKQLAYGRNESMERWNYGRQVKYDFQNSMSNYPSTYGSYKIGYGGFRGYRGHPGRQTFPNGRYPGHFAPRSYGSHMYMRDQIPTKPRVITVVRNGKKPRPNVKVLLNKRSMQSYEELKFQISDIFGPKWQNDKVKKLFTTYGKEVLGISDFYRDEDVFIAVGSDPLTKSDVQDILEELYPDSVDTQRMMKEWNRNQILKMNRKRNEKPQYMYTYAHEKDNDCNQESKRDSGFEDTGSSVDPKPDKDEIIYEGNAARPWRSKSRKPPQHHAQYDEEEDFLTRAERIRNRAAEREREQAQRRQQKKMELERQALEDEKRKRGLVPQKDNDKLKKRQQEKMKERRKKEAEMQRAREEEEKARRKEEERAIRVAAKKIGKKNEDDEVEQVEIIITKGANPQQPVKEPEKEKPKEKKEKAEDNKAHKKKQDNEDDANKNNDRNKDAVDENANKKDDKANKNKDEEDSNKNKENKDNKEKEKKKRTKRTKLDRQISNADHVLVKYEPGRTLGDGNFAIVKQAKMKNTPNEYAMKVIDKSKLKGKEYMVENEIDIMRVCNHPTIVKLYEEYETKDEIYLIMELVKGGDLFDAITQSVKFGEPESASMVTDLTNALFYLHSRNIVHRDLKPENLLVHRNKDHSITLKLADFGLAMEVKEPIFTVCGTPTYVAPEILSEIGYGLEIDMWAVGVITYILLCGFPPFRSPDRNQTELFEYIKAGEYEFLSPYWDSISDPAKDLIEHLLVVDKKRRYTAIDVLCHPWIITCGGATKPPDNMPDHRRNLRKDLESQARVNLESFRNSRNS